MSRRTTILLFLLGLAVFLTILSQTGLNHLWNDLMRIGWLLLPVVLVLGVAFLCGAWSWHTVMSGERRRPPFWRTFVLTVSATALNFVTPVINLGGEPVRIAATAPWLGLRRATGAVVLSKMLHAFSSLISWVMALGVAAWLLPVSLAGTGAIVLGILTLCVLVAALLSAHRDGGLERILHGIHRVPLLRRLGPRIEAHRPTLAALDRQIIDFYHDEPIRFMGALALEVAGRLVQFASFYLICRFAGYQIGFAAGFAVAGLTSLALNLLFFVPFEIGSKEGSIFFLCQLFQLDPTLGVYAAVASRLRDLAWTGLGLLLVPLVAGGARPVVQEVPADAGAG